MGKLVRVLVVEDNAEMRFLLTQMLKQLEVDAVNPASSVAEGLKLLEYGAYDFVLVDVGLGESNGIEFVRQVRSSPENPHRSIPILVVTGQNQMPIVKAAVDAGADSFVAKPVSLLTLGEHVDRVLYHRCQLVNGPTYFGPDRRRFVSPKYKGPERRRSNNGDLEWL